jgi:isopenicillin-N epimerase
MAELGLQLGRTMLAHWHLRPDITYLNHGTVGATPKTVLAAQQALQVECERAPADFMARQVTDSLGMCHGESRLRQVAREVGAFVGAVPHRLALVRNVTSGINAVLQSLRFAPDDEILVTSLGYGAVTYGAQHVAKRAGARVVTVEVPFPPPSAQAIVDAVVGALTPRTRLLIIDHITSETAVVLPVAEIAVACRARGVLVLVDGAHAPGAIPLDIEALGVDFYAANLHKWAMVPRSAGILWCAEAHLADIHPTVISWGLGHGFTKEFDWEGTVDPTAYLAATAALAFMRDVGVNKMQAYNHALVVDAQRMFAERWMHKELAATLPPVPIALLGTMVTLPLPRDFGAGAEAALALRDSLWFDDAIEVPIMAIGDRLWMRLCGQVYVETGDFERLAQALERRL